MFDAKKYFRTNGCVYGVISRIRDDGSQINCGVVFFNNYEEARRWAHYREFDYGEHRYMRSLVSKSQAQGIIHFKQNEF